MAKTFLRQNLQEAMAGYEQWKKTGRSPTATSAYSSIDLINLYRGYDHFQETGTLPNMENGKVVTKPKGMASSPIDFTNLDQGVLSRMKTDYQSGWKSGYNILNPDDTARRLAGQMPYSYASKYTDSAEDQYLLSQGLPSYSQFSKYYYDAENALKTDAKKGNYLNEVMQAWTRGGAFENKADDKSLKAMLETVTEKYGSSYGLSFEDVQKAYAEEKKRIQEARRLGESQRIYYTNQNRNNEYQAQLADLQRRKAAETESLMGESSAGYQKFGGSWRRYVELSQKESLTSEEKTEARAALKAMQGKYTVMYGTRGLSTNMPQEIFNVFQNLANKASGIAGAMAGVTDAFGLDWIADKLAGRNRTDDQSAQAYTESMKAAHEGAYAAGNMAGNLASLLMIGGALKPAIEAIPWLAKLPTALQGPVAKIVADSLTFGVQGAYQATTNTVSRDEWNQIEQAKKDYYLEQGYIYTPVEYKAWDQVTDVLKQFGISMAGGAAGSAMGTIVGEAGKSILATKVIPNVVVGDLVKSVVVSNGLQTKLAEMLRLTLSGTAFAVGNISSTYWMYPRENRPSKEQIARDVVTAFLFSAITSAISTAQITKQNKAYIESAIEQMKREYQDAVSVPENPSEQIAKLDRITEYNNNLRLEISKHYYAGQQSEITKVIQFLEAMDEQVTLKRNGIAVGSTDYGEAAASGNAPFSQSGGLAGGMSEAGGMVPFAPAAAQGGVSEVQNVGGGLMGVPAAGMPESPIMQQEAAGLADAPQALTESPLAEQRAAQMAEVTQAAQNIGLTEAEVQAVTEAYAASVQASPQAAYRLQNSMKAVSSYVAEAEADINVMRIEQRANLQTVYDAMTTAMQSGDIASFNAAKARYMSAVEISNAKLDAAKQKANNKIDTMRDGIMETAQGLKAEQEQRILKQREAAQRGAQATTAKGGLNDGGTEDSLYPSRVGVDSANRGEERAIAGRTGLAGSDAVGQGGSGTRERVQGNTEQRRITAKPTEAANAALQNHIAGKVTADGRPATARFVEQLPPEYAAAFEASLSIAGKNAPDVFLYESDDVYGDAWTDGRGIYLNVNGDLVRNLNHELAHNMVWVNVAGRSVIDAFDGKGIGLVDAYEAFRAERISSPDEAPVDMARELIADMWGEFGVAATDGGRIDFPGVLEEAYHDFRRAFWNAMINRGSNISEGVKDVTEITADLRATGDPEYTRVGKDMRQPATKKAQQSTPWEKDFPQVITAVMWNDAYKNDPDRLAGKKGDYVAAKRLAQKYVTPEMAQKIKRQYPDAVVMPVLDIETEGVNALPAAFSARLSELTGLTLESNVVKINKTEHAKASALVRLLYRPVFTGAVQSGKTYYVIADDFVSLGGTVADLRNYILQNGGRVAGVVTLGASNEASTILPPSEQNIRRLEELGRNELEGILQEYGIASRLEDLTNAEAGVIGRLADRLQGSQADILHGIRDRFDSEVRQEDARRRGTDQITAPSDGAVFNSTENSRIKFQAVEGGKEYGYEMPAIKQKKDGTFYADFTVDGDRKRLENASREALEAEIGQLKQHSVENRNRREIQQAREVLELYKRNLSVPEYYENGGTDHEVALALRGMYIANGKDQGGMINAPALEKLLENVSLWNEPTVIGGLGKQLALSFSFVHRLFENLGNWRDTKSPKGRALNFKEGEALRNTYWGHLQDQGAAATLWENAETGKVLNAFDGKQSTSTLAQMLGEGIITGQDAANAIYNDKNMVVKTMLGVFLFDKHGQLVALSSGGEMRIFDAKYRAQQRKAEIAAAKTAETRKKGQTNEDYLKGIREAYLASLDNAKPIEAKGDLIVQQRGNVVTVTANGNTMAVIENGRKPDVEDVKRLRDALKDFYARVLPQQNGSLTENGYRPIPMRKDYFPHQRRQSHGIQEIIDILKGEAQKLPTEISGLTASFSPGRQYVTHVLEPIRG